MRSPKRLPNKVIDCKLYHYVQNTIALVSPANLEADRVSLSLRLMFRKKLLFKWWLVCCENVSCKYTGRGRGRRRHTLVDASAHHQRVTSTRTTTPVPTLCLNCRHPCCRDYDGFTHAVASHQASSVQLSLHSNVLTG